MKHETFFDIMWTVGTSSVPGAILGLVLLAALTVFVLGFVGSFCAFTLNQAKNLKRLYTDRQTLDLTELHPFTRSILENRCPELQKLGTLAARLRERESPPLREAARGILRNIESTLELYEENSSIRNQILSSLRAQKL